MSDIILMIATQNNFSFSFRKKYFKYLNEIILSSEIVIIHSTYVSSGEFFYGPVINQIWKKNYDFYVYHYMYANAGTFD